MAMAESVQNEVCRTRFAMPVGDVLVVLQVMAMAERLQNEVGNVSIVINCCNLPSPRVLKEHPVPEVRATLDVGVLSHLWVSIIVLLGYGNQGFNVTMTRALQ